MEKEPPKPSAPRFKKKRIALYATGFLLAAFWLLVANDGSTPLPVYHGKTAREWLSDVGTTNSEIAWNAFHRMGSNAVPFLVHEVGRKDSLWERFYSWIYYRGPWSVRAHLSPPVPEDTRWHGVQSLLGTASCKTEIPQLMRILSRGEYVQKQVAEELLLRSVWEHDTDCIPELTIYLNSTNEMVSLTALNMLGQIKLGPEMIPCLTNFPCSTSKTVQFQVANILSRIDWKIASDYLKQRMPEQFAWMTQTNTPER